MMNQTKAIKQIYKRKPDLIEAIQYFDTVEILTQISQFTDITIGLDYSEGKVLKLYKEDHTFYLYEGDYVCKDTKGNVFGMAYEAFHQKYETAIP